MKPFELNITWNKIYDGNFPEKELKELDTEMQVIYGKRERDFKQNIKLTTSIEEKENPLEIAFELGRLLHSYSVAKLV